MYQWNLIRGVVMKNVHKLTEGAVLLAAYAVLILITVYIPVFGAIISLFLSVPFILFGAKNTRMSSFVFFIGACFISIIVGAVLALPLTFSFGLTGLVIGHFFQEKKSRLSTFIAATLVFLVTIIVQYVGFIALFQFNFMKEMIASIKEMINSSMIMMEELGQGIDVTNYVAMLKEFSDSLPFIEVLTPSLFVTTALFSVLLIEVVSLPIVKRFGVKFAARKPFRELTLPKSILWYYLITMLAILMIKPSEGSYWYIAFMNISFILQLLMVIQGLAFIFYFCYQKGIPKALPIFAAILTFLMPLFLSIVRILGIIDLGFELRKRLEKNKN